MAIPRLSLLVVCHGMDDYLAATLPRNMRTLAPDDVLVVHPPGNPAVEEVARACGASTLEVDGAVGPGVFRKGLLICAGQEKLREMGAGWTLHLDCDTLVPYDVADIVVSNLNRLPPGVLVGASRWGIKDGCDLSPMLHAFDEGRNSRAMLVDALRSSTAFSWKDEGHGHCDPEGYVNDGPWGFFQIFHAQEAPPYPDHSEDASGDDSVFVSMHSGRVAMLPRDVPVIHLPHGRSYGVNWKGRTTPRLPELPACSLPAASDNRTAVGNPSIILVSVGRADTLRVTLPMTREAFPDSDIVVATRLGDDSIDVCREIGVACVTVRMPFNDGGFLHKAYMLNTALAKCKPGWVIATDADIVFPRWAAQMLSDTYLDHECLHYCARARLPGPEAASKLYAGPRFSLTVADQFADRMPHGYFQMFHTGASAISGMVGAGNAFPHWFPSTTSYDEAFARRWPTPMRRELPIFVGHIDHDVAISAPARKRSRPSKLIVHTLAASTMNKDIVEASASVFRHFGIERRLHEGPMPHGAWLDKLADDTLDDRFLVMDADCVPTTGDAMERMMALLDEGASMVGIAQTSNHIPPATHIFAGPSCLAVSMRAWERAGSPSFMPKFDATKCIYDTAEGVALAMERHGLRYALVLPETWEETPAEGVWRLHALGVYGIGTHYAHGIYHLGQSRLDRHVSLFVERCSDIVAGRYVPRGKSCFFSKG